MLNRAYRWFNDLIHNPFQVFWICFALAATGVVLDGTAFQLWGLKRDHQVLGQRIREAKKRTHQLDFRIQRAQQPEFIEKAARDQFDLVKEGDLIFIFGDETEKSADRDGSGV